ncbi:hypothetical protein ABIE09_000141 [Lysobacter enzymogenes]|uniref:hypothetical protein n=1 Tax=Lysobacter enzymogenes TaxID=69 RepID=UPI003397C42A
MQERRLSSDWTWWHKRKSLLWASLLLLGFAWLASYFAIPLPLALSIGAICVLTPAIAQFLLVRNLADEVEISGQSLRVRRRHAEIKVALADVERVGMGGFGRHGQLHLELREPGPFGRTISFVPAFGSWRWTLTPGNSTVDDLRARIARARGAPDR